MNQEDADRLVFHSDDYYLGPQSSPRRKQQHRVGQKNYKARNASRKPTEGRAIRWTSQSRGW